MGYMTIDERLLHRAQEIVSLPIGPSTKGRLSITGEPYTILASNGARQEGDPDPDPPKSRREAIESYFASVKKFSQGCRGRLYWRHPPSLEYMPSGRWQVYSRLLISDQPEICL